jgi:hypothetical protein
MGQYLGKNELEKAIAGIDSRNQNLIKGLSAELNVGNLLEKYLPGDTYVIAHPQIGRYDPDFLVISPRYGFRIIEVKNWDPSNISAFQSNGSINFKNQESANPMGQVKKHRDELWDYLRTSFNISNATVDCLVLHYGMTKDKFQNDFDKNWNPDFYRNTIFRDQLNEDIDKVLRNSPKVYSKGIGTYAIEQIVNSVVISENIFNVEKLTEELSKERKQNKTYEKEQGTVKKLVYVVIAMLIVMTVGIYKIMPSDSTQGQIEKDTNTYESETGINPDMQSVSQGLPLESEEVASDADKNGQADPPTLPSNSDAKSTGGNDNLQSNLDEPQSKDVKIEPPKNSQITISELIGSEQNVGKQFELSLLVKDLNFAHQ